MSASGPDSRDSAARKIMESFRQVDASSKIAEGESVYAFRVRIQPPSNWYNGESYADMFVFLTSAGQKNKKFEDQKWIADFHFALGITFMCQHLTLYTMKGEQKRDYPPTISYHQPYMFVFLTSTGQKNKKLATLQVGE